MDPLGQPNVTVNINDLPTWNLSTPPIYKVEDEDVLDIVFPVSLEINSILSIWEGALENLKVHSIVHVLNDSGQIHNAPLFSKMGTGAHDLNWVDSLAEIKQCRTGEAKITKGFKLPCRYVIHTVGPRYNSRYQSAAENALYNCYRNSLMLHLENNLKTIAIPPIHSNRLCYPMEAGGHIALRTIRRFLEKCGKSISRLVLVVPRQYTDVYMKLLPLYFPRNNDEEIYSKQNLPLDVGNEFGEPVRADRVIRIASNPIKRIGGHASDSQDESNDDDESDETTGAANQHVVEAVEGVQVDTEARENPGLHAFGKMEQSPDVRHRAKQAVQFGGTLSIEEALSAQRRYERWLRKSYQTDLSSVANLHCMYQGGVDTQGRAIIVVVGKYFPANTIDFHKAAMFFIHLMDKVVNGRYSVVYLHTQTGKENQPPLAFIRDIYNVVDARYKHNLHAFFIVHSGFWARIFTWFFTTFSAAEVKSKVHRLTCLAQLFNYIDPNQLDLPDFVYQYDKKVDTTSGHRNSYVDHHDTL